MPESGANGNRLGASIHPERGFLLISSSATREFDFWIDDEIDAVLDAVESNAAAISAADLSIYNVMRYHLGIMSASFEPERSDPGKRLRSKLCLLCCDAAGADPRLAVPVSAAVELLHNFTLIHDDIQDMANLRRHRPTVWSLWGIPQAINAGDAMFAAAHVALNRSVQRGVSPAVTLDLSTELHHTTLRIVEGQVLDLGFETRDDVTPAEYLTMIRSKTAAIIQFACWAGGRIGHAPSGQMSAFAEFGNAIGMGFQIRDDFLGVWGSEETTGKSYADDIRRRKQSLPVIILKERASNSERREIASLYAADELDADAVEWVLQMMERHEVSESVQMEVTRWHDRAFSLLDNLDISGESGDVITALLGGLVNREV